MENAYGSDDTHEVDLHNLPDLFADASLVQQPSNTRTSNPRASWLSEAPSRSSPSLYSGRPTTLLPRRTSSNRARTEPNVPNIDVSSQAGPSNTQAPALFTSSSRSIFSSGPPTSSVSVNTAHASLSSLSATTRSNNSSTHPLSALSAPSISNAKRSAAFATEPASSSGSSRKTRFTGVTKDVDDPSNSLEDSALGRRRETPTPTPTAVSRLFCAPEPTSPSVSRKGSYVRTASGAQYHRAMTTDTAPLPSHLYNQGLLSGRHSDIIVIAFETRYPLHRLLLDRAPFFRSAFSEPWHESSAKEITLHPDDIDSNITKSAFELALKRIYGCHCLEEEDKEASALFATGCWLEMSDLIEASVHSLLRQMAPTNISKSIQLATSNYYGKDGNRILAAAKAMLCREGWEMPLRYFDGISGEIIREIVGCDGFYVPTEWNRYIIAKRLLNRRLKTSAIEAGLIDLRARPIVPMPDSMRFMTIRFDTVYRKSFAPIAANSSSASDRWLAVYITPDIAALLVLLDEGIHYMHMNFEQLQRIRETRDVLGLPLLPEKVISQALWHSMELRQSVVNAYENELELGLSHEVEESSSDSNDETPRETAFSLEKSAHALGKEPEAMKLDEEDDDEEMDSGSWDGNGMPRKFWIPVADATYPLGDDLEPVLPHSPPPLAGHRPRTSLDPQDLQWATDFGSAAQERPETPQAISNIPSPQISYTHYPPFRFAVEFPPIRTLKENKRVYSSTVWYAGSLWNVYVQKKETSKGTQLGIYLHRERHVDANGELLTKTFQNSVNDRINDIERDAGLSRTSRGTNDQIYANDDSSSGGDTTLINGASLDLDTLSGLLSSTPANGAQKLTEANMTPSAGRRLGSDTPMTEDSREDAMLKARKYRTATLPPYVDGRPTIRTYFKIFTPSKGGRVLTVYESAPDKFNFSQSWGWKSSNLVFDDVVTEGEEGRAKDPRLRFMVVIGNV